MLLFIQVQYVYVKYLLGSLKMTSKKLNMLFFIKTGLQILDILRAVDGQKSRKSYANDNVKP